MRARSFILLFLVIVLIAVIAVAYVLRGQSGGDVLDDVVVADPAGSTDDGQTAQEPNLPTPSPTPSTRLVPVVVTKVQIPAGTRLTEEYLEVEMRPDTNIAVQANYIYSDITEVVGRIAGVEIARGQAVLSAMLALSPADLASMGSDLALFATQGNVVLAMPIDRYSGAAYAMRPGDLIDILMTVSLVARDEEFQTALPNLDWRVNQQNLENGSNFLFTPIAQGRLELVAGINLVASIGPGGQESWDVEGGELLQIPRRATQLTIQQARVVWVGTWRDPRIIEQQQAQLAAAAAAGTPVPTAQSAFERQETMPDLILLSMPAQDALVLKWAMDRGLNIDLALRSQGDTSAFFTTSVSFPQLVEQGGLTIPEPGLYDVEERADEVERPAVPPGIPEN